MSFNKYQQIFKDILLHAQDFQRVFRPDDPDLERVIGVVEFLDLEISRSRLLVTLLAVLTTVLLCLLVKVNCGVSNIQRRMPQAIPAAHIYVPVHNLSMYEQWVIAFEQSATYFSKPSEAQPLSENWIINVAYHLIIGEQSLAQKRFKNAVTHLEQALVIFPELKGVREPLGIAYLSAGQWAQAETNLMIALEEEVTFPVIGNLGATYLEANKLHQAEPYLLTAGKLEPQNPGCHKNLALFYRKKKMNEEAIVHYEIFLDLLPEDLDTTEVYVNYLVELGRQEYACSFLKSQSDKPIENVPAICLLWAKMEVQAEHTTQAVVALNKMTKHLSPSSALEQMNVKEFDTIRDQEAFQALVQQVELSMIALEDGW